MKRLFIGGPADGTRMTVPSGEQQFRFRDGVTTHLYILLHLHERDASGAPHAHGVFVHSNKHNVISALIAGYTGEPT